MQQRILTPPGWTWHEEHGFVQGHEVSGAQRLVFLAGQVGADDNGNPLHPGDMRAQIALALDNIERVLAAGGMTLANVTRLNFYTTDIAAFHTTGAYRTERLQRANCRPASTLLGVASLFHPDVLVEIEATAAA